LQFSPRCSLEKASLLLADSTATCGMIGYIIIIIIINEERIRVTLSHRDVVGAQGHCT